MLDIIIVYIPLYFLANFYQYLSKKNFYLLLIFSLIFSLPAIGYFYYIIENYNFFGALFNYGKLNIYSNILTILSIFLFYLILIIIFNLKLIFIHFKDNFLLFFLY